MSDFQIGICVVALFIFLAWSLRELERFIERRIREEVADQLDDARVAREEEGLAKQRREIQLQWTPEAWMAAGRKERELGLMSDEWPLELLREIGPTKP
jgi:hypothetical protein